MENRRTTGVSNLKGHANYIIIKCHVNCNNVSKRPIEFCDGNQQKVPINVTNHDFRAAVGYCYKIQCKIAIAEMTIKVYWIDS